MLQACMGCMITEGTCHGLAHLAQDLALVRGGRLLLLAAVHARPHAPPKQQRRLRGLLGQRVLILRGQIMSA